MRSQPFIVVTPLLVTLVLASLPWNWGCSNSNATAPVTVTQIVVATPPPSTLAGRDWTYSTLAAAFPSHYYFAGLVFNNKMWVIGGQSSGFLNDVWSSPDGITWSQVLADNASPGPNQFSRRSQPTAFVFNNKMWVVGGANVSNAFNDVWSSPDGVTWTQVLADNASPGPNQFPRRGGCTALAFNNKMWVIGGFAAGWLNDVWSSSDGVSWTNVLVNNGSPGPNQFPGRTGHASVVYNNQMWVMAGSNGAGLNDVWSSSDGVSWVRTLTDNGSPGPNQFSRRNSFASLVYGNAMWVIGGNTGAGILNDVWFSADGVSWNSMTTSAAFPVRYAHAGLSFNGDMWVIAGAGGGVIKNDVWHSPF